jgi:hypothetical protein
MIKQVRTLHMRVLKRESVDARNRVPTLHLGGLVYDYR